MTQKKTSPDITAPKKINHRSLLRLMAAQLLYQYDFYNMELSISHLADDLIDNYVLDDGEQTASSYRDLIDAEQLKKLAISVIENIKIIDEEIESFLQKSKNISELPDVMLQIVRLAVFELKFKSEVPLKVVINEYVDIAGCFYDAKKVPFVNSILENIAAKNRSEEFSQIKQQK